jgi:hypothetical protein
VSELDFHPEPEQLEAYAEGTIEIAQRAVLESHLLGCARCSADVEEWRGLFVALDALPPIEPSPGFVDRVMAGVRVLPTPSRTAAEIRWLPTSTKGWALVAGFLALPVIGIAVLVAWVLSQPWATAAAAQTVLNYAWTTVTSSVAWVSGQLSALFMETTAVQTVAGLSKQFFGALGTTGLGLAIAGFCLAALGSAWVLYHYLVRTSTRVTNYAPYTI